MNGHLSGSWSIYECRPSNWVERFVFQKCSIVSFPMILIGSYRAHSWTILPADFLSHACCAFHLTAVPDVCLRSMAADLMMLIVFDSLVQSSSTSVGGVVCGVVGVVVAAGLLNVADHDDW